MSALFGHIPFCMFREKYLHLQQNITCKRAYNKQNNEPQYYGNIKSKITPILQAIWNGDGYLSGDS